VKNRTRGEEEETEGGEGRKEEKKTNKDKEMNKISNKRNAEAE